MKSIAGALTIFMLTTSLHAFDLSHPQWTEALKEFNNNGLIHYRQIKKNPEALNRYIKELEHVSIEEYTTWTDNHKIAFWINAYNALTIRAIVDHYPIQPSRTKSTLYPKNSIRQIDGIWDKQTFLVMGQNLTLDHIEHKILRPHFREPRIHMALVCAALGCPPLRSEAYVGEKLHNQLEDQSRLFLSDPHKFKIDRAKKTVFLSAIFDWFGEDFIHKGSTVSNFKGLSPKEKSVLSFIIPYLNSEDRQFLETNTPSLTFLSYDWALNEQPH